MIIFSPLIHYIATWLSHFKHVWLLIVLDSLSWSTRLWSLPTMPVKVIWKRQRRSVKCRLVTCNCCNHFVNLLSLMCQCCCSDFNVILTKKVIMTVTLLSGLTNWHKDGLLCYIMQKEVGQSFYVGGVYTSHRLQLLCIASFFSYTCILHRLKSCSWYNIYTAKISTQSSFIPRAWDTLFKWSVGMCKINWKIRVSYVAVHWLMFYSSWRVCLWIF